MEFNNQGEAALWKKIVAYRLSPFLHYFCLIPASATILAFCDLATQRVATTTNIGITWQFIKNSESQTPFRCAESKSALKKSHRLLVNFEGVVFYEIQR